jgi:non-homologous end joining protein Ku
MTELERAIEALKIAHSAVRDFDASRYPDAYTAAVAQLRVVKQKRKIRARVEAAKTHA